MDEPCAPPAQVSRILSFVNRIIYNSRTFFFVKTSPSKTKTEREKPTIKNADVKKSKQKVLSRRNSSRSQNQTPSTPKIEYVYENRYKILCSCECGSCSLNVLICREIMASPSTPSSSKTNDMASTKKKSLLLVYHGLAGQKYSGVFQKPIANKTVKGYEEVIYWFVCLDECDSDFILL